MIVKLVVERFIDGFAMNGRQHYRRQVMSDAALLVGTVALALEDAPHVNVIGIHEAALWVTFANIDFTLYPARDGESVIDVRWQISVREAKPGLGTWWADQRTRYPVDRAAAGLADDVRNAAERIRHWLDERRPAPDSAPPPHRDAVPAHS